ncbi:MotA/TolQ/ExbB proton channel family protein [Guyparkeria sp.]|uniref:MotA/TolQ/ExbB proton channel family protein n=1 Tax=Guyparkeria sp. TaxID=2035736 RepID=UPI003569D08F
MNILTVFEHGDAVLITVFAILALMSIATWATAATRLLAHFDRRRRSRESLQRIAASRRAAELDEAFAERDDPPAVIARAGLAAARGFRGQIGTSPEDNPQLDAALIRGIRQELDRQETRVQAGQLLFATVGALAPFIGLFGTVWGIHGALLDLAGVENVSMERVAGPLGEALVATAAGLGAAIPAVLFFNLFNRSHRLYRQTLEAAAHDVHALLMHDPQLGPWARAEDRRPTDIETLRPQEA